MRAIDWYSLSPPAQKHRRAVLERRGGAQVMEVDGALLEAQFELDDGSRLIWVTDDSPYDEGLHIYLLGPDDTTSDSLQAGADFTAGILRFAQIGDWSVDFEFFKNSVLYRLEIELSPRRRLWLPAGWKYGHPLSKHRMVVSEIRTGGR